MASQFSKVLSKLKSQKFDACELAEASMDIDDSLFSFEDIKKLKFAKEKCHNGEILEFCELLEKTNDPCKLVTIAEAARRLNQKALAVAIENSILTVCLEISGATDEELDAKKKTFESLMCMFERWSELTGRIEQFTSQLENAVVKWYFENHPQATTKVQLHPAASSRVGFKAVNVNRFPYYFSRPKIEREILENLKTAATFPIKGALAIKGGAGAGKTTITSYLLTDNKDSQKFMLDECQLNVAIWLNCFQWNDSFDEKDFEQKLIGICRQAAPTLPHGTTNLEDVVQHLKETYNGQSYQPIFIFDNMFNVKLLEFFRLKCPEAVCCVVTRDIYNIYLQDKSAAAYRLLGPIVSIPEYERNEVEEALKTTYNLAGKLSEKQLKELSQRCCRLPLIVGLVGPRFSYCDSENLQDEFNMVMAELNSIAEMPLSRCPYKTVDQLFQYSFDRIDDEKIRTMYYAFLLWNPAEPVLVRYLAIIWGVGDEEALVICNRYESSSIIRRIIPKSDDQNVEKKFLIHQALHEAAYRHAKSKLANIDSLSRLRLAVLKGLCLQQIQNNTSQIFGNIHLKDANFLQPILQNLDSKCFLELCDIQVDDEVYAMFLHYASSKGHLEVVEKLCQKCPKAAEIPCHVFVQTALTYATWNGYIAIVNFLYEKYPRAVKIKSKSGRMPLSYAAGYGDQQIVEFLYEKYPKAVEIPSDSGRTPLSYAAGYGHQKIVEFLFEKHPAAAKVVDINGETPLSLATFWRRQAVVDFLSRNNDKKNDLVCDALKSQAPLNKRRKT